MPCESVRTAGQTEAARRREIDAALAELERKLAAGAVAVRIGTDGAVCFADWGTERRGVTDVCAYQTLAGRDSWELRQAVARAEALAGRSVSAATVAAGVHSHDGGRTWGGAD